jgi:uncharacterized tellurite resistance protein B-like protein
MSYAITSEDLQGLSEDQQVAIMESLILAVAADHRTSKTEVTQFEAAINAIPWKLDPAKVMSDLTDVRTRVLALDAAGASSLINQIAERLPFPELREKLFHAMASVMAVDGLLNNDDKMMLLGYVKAFGITNGQVDAIKADIKARAQDS